MLGSGFVLVNVIALGERDNARVARMLLGGVGSEGASSASVGTGHAELGSLTHTVEDRQQASVCSLKCK